MILNDILITGGTGSFGNACAKTLIEMCEIPNAEQPRIIIYSRDEAKQARMRERFANNPHLRFFIGDVRDRDRLRRAFDGVHTVIHAAALKRIEVGAYNPSEMIKTNVMGSMNVIEACHDADVAKAILLSSDKAYQPISAYGCSKAMAEALFLAANNARGQFGPAYAAVRYGNVAGSNGSVIPTWRRLIARGDPVPVTDPDCTRFWMWQQEAVDLVLDTLRTMRGGELAIPRLPAYRLGDLAIAMGARTEIVGLPPHEKRHEGMRGGLTSDIADRLTSDELRNMLEMIPEEE